LYSGLKKLRKRTKPPDWIIDIPNKNLLKNHSRSFSLNQPTRIIICKSKSAIDNEGCGKK
jgi:hypothetical protein